MDLNGSLSSSFWAGHQLKSTYLVPVSSIHDCLSAEKLRDFLCQPQNLILGQTASLEEERFYLLGIDREVEAVFSADQARSKSSVTEFSQTDTAGIYKLRADRGKYVIELTKDGTRLRKITINAEPKRLSIPFEDLDRGAVNMAILVPQTWSWMINLINSLLAQHNFYLIASRNSREYIYHRQLTMSWSIAVVPYEDFDTILSLSNTVKFANDVLLLLEEDSLNSVTQLMKIFASYSDVLVFTPKKDCSFALSYDAVKPASAKLVISQLKAFASNNVMAVSGAKVPKKAGKEIENLLMEFLALPSSFKSKRVYLNFSFASGILFTEDMAKQFTSEILPTARVWQCLKGSHDVLVSCSVFSIWVLATILEDKAKEYPCLIAVKEIFVADLDQFPECRALQAQMRDDDIPNVSDTRFSWKKLALKFQPPFCQKFATQGWKGCPQCECSHVNQSDLLAIGVCQLSLENGECRQPNCRKLHPEFK